MSTVFSLLTDDRAFKHVFSHKEILEDFIKSFLDYIGKDGNIKMLIEIEPQAYITSNNKKYRAYYGDLLLVEENTIISLEMYKDRFRTRDYNKSLGYLCRLYSNQKRGIKSQKYKKVISLNLIKGNYKRENSEIVNGYSIKNKITNKEINDNIVMYLVRYDKVKEIPFRKDENRFIRYLRIIGSDSVKEIEKIAKGDEYMEDAIKFLKEWNQTSSEENFKIWCDELRDEGRIEGRAYVAKKMLENGISIEEVSRITEIPIKDIMKLKENK